MNKLSLVIDISSDAENNRYTKTLAVNTVGRLNLSDLSVEILRGSEADPGSSTFFIYTLESDFSPKKLKISPIKKTVR